jgi:serine/threonine protein kinase
MSHNHFEAPSTAHLAELLPQYDIENLIAQGGMGAVYKGRQRTLDRDIAIKILPKELGDSEFRRAFTSEAKAMARLNHPNLLGVFDFGEIEGMPYIVMEYVHGESLYGASHNQAIDPLQAIEIVRGICDGLAHAHENGIIHRDIKPSNILLTINAKPKIGDFGLAHAAESDHPGLMMGTPGYTAPEVFHNPDLAGKLADIYSVGIILHQLLTGIDPAGCMEPPSQMTGDIRLDSIWRKAVNMDPNQRYQTVESMAADLKKWAEFKTANPLLNNTRPYRPSTRRVPLTRASVGNDSSSTLKWFVIAILAGCAFFIFQHLQKRKKEIALGNEDKSGAIITPVQRPPISNRQEPVTQPQIPRVNLSERDPYDIPDNELSKPPFKDSEIVRKKIVKPDKSETPDPEPDNDKDISPGDPELLKRAVELIADARKKRDKKLADNASSLIFKLGSLIRENKTDDGPTISDFREKIVANRIPEVEDSSERPDQFTIKLKQAIDSETTIDVAYDLDLIRIRDAYVSRLTTAAGDTSDADLKHRLTAQAALAKDLAPWINQISPEPK